ncbi:unnamed protein product, partial [Cyprideis torosa]
SSPPVSCPRDVVAPPESPDEDAPVNLTRLCSQLDDCSSCSYTSFGCQWCPALSQCRRGAVCEMPPPLGPSDDPSLGVLGGTEYWSEGEEGGLNGSQAPPGFEYIDDDPKMDANKRFQTPRGPPEGNHIERGGRRDEEPETKMTRITPRPQYTRPGPVVPRKLPRFPRASPLATTDNRCPLDAWRNAPGTLWDAALPDDVKNELRLHCLSIHTCHLCQAQSHCRWLEERGAKSSCQFQEPNASAAPSSSGWGPVKMVKEVSCRPACSSHRSCLNCTKSGCMWCFNARRCVESNAYIPSYPFGQCMGWTLRDSQCPVPPSPPTAPPTTSPPTGPPSPPTGTAPTATTTPSPAPPTSPTEPPTANVTSTTAPTIPPDVDVSPLCSPLATCEACQRNPACGWCDDGSGTGLGRCLEGNYLAPALGSNSTCFKRLWFFSECP